MATLKLSIVSPAGKAFEGDAESVVAPGREGSLGVLVHHAPMIAALRPGVCTVKAGGETAIFFTGEGVIEVSHGETVLLVDEATRVEKVDDARDLLRRRIDRQARAAAPAAGGAS